MNINLTLIENDVNSLKRPLENEMEGPISHFSRELIKIRAGRAHISLIEDIQVECYEQPPVALKGLAALSVPEARLLVVQPWDTSIIGDIEKAILTSDLGVTPVNDGKIIRLTLPEMSTQRRDDLVKILGKKLEECKIGIRNVRKDFNNIIRDAKKEKTVSKNFCDRLDDVLKQITETFIKKAEQMAEKKKTDITNI